MYINSGNLLCNCSLRLWVVFFFFVVLIIVVGVIDVGMLGGMMLYVSVGLVKNRDIKNVML